MLIVIVFCVALPLVANYAMRRGLQSRMRTLSAREGFDRDHAVRAAAAVQFVALCLFTGLSVVLILHALLGFGFGWVVLTMALIALSTTPVMRWRLRKLS